MLRELSSWSRWHSIPVLGLIVILLAVRGFGAVDEAKSNVSSFSVPDVKESKTHFLTEGESLWSVAENKLVDERRLCCPNLTPDAIRVIVIFSQTEGYLPLGFDPWGPERRQLQVGQKIAVPKNIYLVINGFYGDSEKVNKEETLNPTPTPKIEVETSSGCPTADQSSFASAMFSAINNERVQQGMPALAVHRCVVYIAKIRSDDMAALNYFSHTSPNGDTAFSLMDRYVVPYGWAGENLARNNYPDNESVGVAIRDLMASAGHRANILGVNYTHLGVGAAVDEAGMKYFTMIFVGPP